VKMAEEKEVKKETVNGKQADLERKAENALELEKKADLPKQETKEVKKKEKSESKVKEVKKEIKEQSDKKQGKEMKEELGKTQQIKEPVKEVNEQAVIEQFNPYEIIKYPLSTEKGIRQIEFDNKLVFVVHARATKPDVKKAVEELFKVRVVKVNIQNSFTGEKKAYVKLGPESLASDVSADLGLI